MLIVILVFLQDWRATLVPATTVPVTIIGAFAAMAALGFTVNLSTLFAHRAGDRHRGGRCDRHRGRRRAPHRARPVRRTTRRSRRWSELFGPIIGITLVLMSVFLPAAFLPGLTGQMYAQFALVIAATALISAINAATLKPTQCALWLRMPVPPEKRNFFFRGFNRGLSAGRECLRRLIGAHGAPQRHRWSSSPWCWPASACWGIARLPTAFIPIEDQGYVMVGVQLPDGASLERTQRGDGSGDRRSRCDARRRSGDRDRRHLACSTTTPRWPTPASPT